MIPEKPVPEGKDTQERQEAPHRDYTPPKIISYTSEEILDEIGPAQACSPAPCAID